MSTLAASRTRKNSPSCASQESQSNAGKLWHHVDFSTRSPTFARVFLSSIYPFWTSRNLHNEPPPRYDDEALQNAVTQRGWTECAGWIHPHGLFSIIGNLSVLFGFKGAQFWLALVWSRRLCMYTLLLCCVWNGAVDAICNGSWQRDVVDDQLDGNASYVTEWWSWNSPCEWRSNEDQLYSIIIIIDQRHISVWRPVAFNLSPAGYDWAVKPSVKHIEASMQKKQSRL